MIRLVVIGLTALGMCGGGYAAWQILYLPHPSDASPTQLGYWLVLRDMSQQPEDIQLALIDRLIEDPTVFSTSNDSSIQLSDSQEQQLRANIGQLKYTWFQDRVRQYHEAAPADRWGFLESQIDVVEDWATLMFENAAVLYPDAPSDQDFSKLFFDEVESWLGDTPPEKHPQAYAAVAQGIVCWLGTCSLTEQPDSARLELASRVTRELDLGVEIGASFGIIPEQCQSQLADNCELLVEAWLLDTARKYAAVPAGKQKGDFVDKLVDKFEKWKVFELLGSFNQTSADSPENSAANAPNVTQSIQRFDEMVKTWIARAKDDQGKSMKQLVSAVKARLFVKMFSRSWQSEN